MQCSFSALHFIHCLWSWFYFLLCFILCILCACERVCVCVHYICLLCFFSLWFSQKLTCSISIPKKLRVFCHYFLVIFIGPVVQVIWPSRRLITLPIYQMKNGSFNLSWNPVEFFQVIVWSLCFGYSLSGINLATIRFSPRRLKMKMIWSDWFTCKYPNSNIMSARFSHIKPSDY